MRSMVEKWTENVEGANTGATIMIPEEEDEIEGNKWEKGHPQCSLEGITEKVIREKEDHLQAHQEETTIRGDTPGETPVEADQKAQTGTNRLTPRHMDPRPTPRYKQLSPRRHPKEAKEEASPKEERIKRVETTIVEDMVEGARITMLQPQAQLH